MTIHEKLRTLRREKGLTQTELGQKIGRFQQEIHRWETGKGTIPANDIPLLAKALDVPIDAFFSSSQPALAATPED